MGKELDELFDLADFAIGSLARHRSHIDKIKTLKNREYAARGIPFIYSETDEDFDRMPYILKAPADESAILEKSNGKGDKRVIKILISKIKNLHLSNNIQEGAVWIENRLSFIVRRLFIFPEE